MKQFFNLITITCCLAIIVACSNDKQRPLILLIGNDASSNGALGNGASGINGVFFDQPSIRKEASFKFHHEISDACFNAELEETHPERANSGYSYVPYRIDGTTNLNIIFTNEGNVNIDVTINPSNTAYGTTNTILDSAHISVNQTVRDFLDNSSLEVNNSQVTWSDSDTNLLPLLQLNTKNATVELVEQKVEGESVWLTFETNYVSTVTSSPDCMDSNSKSVLEIKTEQ